MHCIGACTALHLRTPEDGVLALQRVAVTSNSYKVCNRIVWMNIQCISQTQEKRFMFFTI